MNELEELATAWSNALRSGEYVQTRGALADLVEEGDEWYENNCCLGVFARIIGSARTIITANELRKNQVPNLRYTVCYGGSMHTVHHPLFEVLTRHPAFKGNTKFPNVFTVLNDTHIYNYSFEEIADVIDGLIYGGFFNES